jgi:hypothetical protein
LNEEASVQLSLRDFSTDMSLCDFVDHLRPERPRGPIVFMVANKPSAWKTMEEFRGRPFSHAGPPKTRHDIELGHLDLTLSKSAYESEADLVSFTKKHKGKTALLLPVRIEIRVVETPLRARLAAVEGFVYVYYRDTTNLVRLVRYEEMLGDPQPLAASRLCDRDRSTQTLRSSLLIVLRRASVVTHYLSEHVQPESILSAVPNGAMHS